MIQKTTLQQRAGTYAIGVFIIGIDESSPLRIVSFGVEAGERGGPAADGVPPPPINATMTSEGIDRQLDGYFQKLAADEVFSGLADFFGPEFNNAAKDRFASNADYFTFVGSLPPIFAPGERDQYCNGCYIALGDIVEKVSGMPYEKFVADNVFGRAEMTSSAVQLRSANLALANALAR